MGLLDDAFASLSSECVGQLSESTITVRKVVRAALTGSTLSRGETYSDVAVAAVRSASRAVFEGLGEGGGGGAAMEEWDYLVVASALLLDGTQTQFVPAEGDRIIDASTGTTLTYAIERVVREVNETMVKMTVRGVRQKQR